MAEGTMGMGDGCCGSEMAGWVDSGPGTDTLVIVVVVTFSVKLAYVQSSTVSATTFWFDVIHFVAT